MWDPAVPLPICVLEGSTRDGSLEPVALAFPGQGAQYVRMLEGVKDLPAVRRMLELAKPILGYDVLELCLRGPDWRLEETRYCQPALFIACLAGVVKLRRQNELALAGTVAVAGLSLGEYAALCVAGVFGFEEGLELVMLRGEAMQEAVEQANELSRGAMVSVVGFPRDKLEQCCGDVVNQTGGSVCQIAVFLFPEGYVVSAGTAKAAEMLEVFIKKKGAQRTKRLSTAGAFHTPAMQPARQRLSRALRELLPRMRPPRCEVWMNATGRPVGPGTPPEEIVALLEEQLTGPVMWETCLRGLISTGARELYEVGPGKQVKAMIKRIDPEAWKQTQNVEV